MGAGVGLRRLRTETELLGILGSEHFHALVSRARARARALLSYLHFRILPFLFGDTVSCRVGHAVMRTGLLG